MKRYTIRGLGLLCCLLLVFLFAAAGCDDNGGDKDELKVALVTAAAGRNDNGYNQSAVKGLEKAKTDYDLPTPHIVDKSDDIPGALRQLAEEGYKLIFTLEYNFDALIKGVGGSKPIAEDFPDTTFVVFNDNPNLGDDGKAIHKNVVSVLFDVHEASFMAGALSVLVNENSETLFGSDHALTTGEAGRKVGFLGGTNSNGITVFSYGYAEGINYMAKEMNVNYTMYSDYNAGFSDSAAGATKANTYYSDGANIVVCVAGSVGDGVTAKAKEVKKLAIEVDADKDSSQAGYVLTSILKNTEVPVLEICKHFKDGTMDQVNGKALSYSLKSGATGITDLSTIEKSIPDSGKTKWTEIKGQLDTIAGKIGDGTIDVTNAQAGESFDKSKLANLSMPND